MTEAGTYAATLAQLQSAEIKTGSRVLNASNAVFLVELDAPDPSRSDSAMQAIYKPRDGERPLWDFPPGTLYLRERAAFLLDQALGLQHIPPTVVRDDGPFGTGCLQLFVHRLQKKLPEGEYGDLETQLRELAAFDVISNNADRKQAHMLIDESFHLYGIDNALTFLPYPRQRTVLLELGGSEFPKTAQDAVQRLAQDRVALNRLRAGCEELLSREEISATVDRIQALAAAPQYPELDPLDGRPFEWW